MLVQSGATVISLKGASAMQVSRLPTRVAATVVAGILVCLVGFTFAIDAMRNESNERAASEAVGYVAAAFSDLHRELSEVSGDFALWGEAFDAMLAHDLDWLYDNYAASAVNGLIFDGLILFGGPFDEPLAWSAADPRRAPSPTFLPPELLSHIAQEVAKQPLGERVTFDTATVIDGRLVLISAIRTQPNIEVASTLEPAAHPIAVTTETLDDTELAELAHSLFLDSLAFAPEPRPDLSSLPVTNAVGDELGHLVWAPPRPGSEIVSTMAPILIAAGLVFATLGGLAAWLAHVHARHLVFERVEAHRLARTDSMTGLPNRLAFREHVAEVESRQAPHAGVLFIDLNGFKAVNDSLGHAGGDALVAGVAERLKRLTGEGMFLARLGGDEFVFVLSGASGVALRAGTLTRDVMAAMAEPFSVLGHTLRISLSQGLALRDAPDVSLDHLVRQADIAMYRAKRERAQAERSHPPGHKDRGQSQMGEDRDDGAAWWKESVVH